MIEIKDGIECNFDRIQNNVTVKSIIKDIGLNNKGLNDFGELCSQLKVLYTAITRSKNSIIIYDQDSTLRKPIETLAAVGYCIVSKQRNVATLSSSLKEKRTFLASCKVFYNNGDDVLYKQAMGNKQATQAGMKLIEIDAERNAITKNFESSKSAGKCYFSAKKYKDPDKNFSKFRCINKLERVFRCQKSILKLLNITKSVIIILRLYNPYSRQENEKKSQGNQKHTQNKCLLKPLLAFQSQEKKAILEKGILGSITIHTILENVSPEFLTVKIGKKVSAIR